MRLICRSLRPQALYSYPGSVSIKSTNRLECADQLTVSPRDAEQAWSSLEGMVSFNCSQNLSHSPSSALIAARSCGQTSGAVSTAIVARGCGLRGIRLLPASFSAES